jgi:hypothetical protein
MKNSITTLIAIAILAIAGIASAQNTDSKPASANVNMVCPISLQKAADLNFGNVIIGTGTVTVPNSGTPTLTYTGNVNPGSNVGTPPPNAAYFHVKGATAYYFNITNSGNNVVVTGPGSSTLNVLLNNPTDNNPIRLSYSEAGSCLGTYDFYIGGVLTVTPGASAGAYTGTWTETVTYN